MQIATIEEITRIPLSVDYRRVYRGRVHVQVGRQCLSPSEIEFALELSPFGNQNVTVRFLDRTDYPIVPALRILKEYIKSLDRSGGLP